MNKVEFYYFKNLIHKTQPDNSNWCWAACLSSLIDSFSTSSNIGNTQCNLASYYKVYLKNQNQQPAVFTNCCHQLNPVISKCNKGIEDDHIVDLYKYSGFKATERHRKQILDYDWVKAILIRNQAPLLVKLRSNRQAHANLVIGYGEVNDCEYLLLSDPLDFSVLEYRSMSLIKILGVEKIWELEKFRGTKLETDLEILGRYEKAIAFIAKLKNKANSELEDPTNYIGYKYPAVIDALFKNLDKSDFIDQAVQSRLESDFGNQKINNQCQMKVPKNPQDDGNIIGLQLKDVENPTEETIELLINDDFDCRIYLKEYAIELQVFIDETNRRKFLGQSSQTSIRNQGERQGDFIFSNFTEESYFKNRIMVFPLSAPSNYNLNYTIQTIEDFKIYVSQFPKAEFFASEDSSPSPHLA